MILFSVLIMFYTAPLWLAVCILGTRHFLHTLQLCSYQLPGYFRSVYRAWKRDWLPCMLSAACFVAATCFIRTEGVAEGFFSGGEGNLPALAAAALLFFLSLVFVLITLVRFFPRKAKKKFIVTPRVGRLILTLSVLFVIQLAVHWLLGLNGSRDSIRNLLFDPVRFVAPVGLLPLFVALGALVNGPWEKAINQGFIDDAVRILKEQPRLRIIGVTGSYGKTSVKYYLKTILSEQFDVLMTPESYNTPMGVVRTIREQMKPTHEIFVCEMGARHVGDIKEITDFVHPDDGVLTAIGEQHMETFFTQENIVKTKYELLDAVEEKHPGGERKETPPASPEATNAITGTEKKNDTTKAGGLKFVNGDNEQIRANMKYPDAITYGLEEGNDFRAIDLHVTGSGTAFKIQLSKRIAQRLVEEKGYAADAFAREGISVTNSDETDEPSDRATVGRREENRDAGTEFHTVLVGAHNIQNITGAIAVATMYGIPAPKIKMGVRRIAPVPHRLELKKHGNVTILDDAFNSNPAGAKAALDTLSMFEDAVKILVTPGMVELGEREDALNEVFGTQAAKVCDYIILVGEKQTAAVKKGITDAGFDEQRLFVRSSFNEASVLMYELDAGREKVILLENDLPDNY